MPKPQNIDMTTMSYVARRRLQVNGTVRNPGDAVPEAAHWRNLSSYIASGHIAIVQPQNNHPMIRKNPGAKHTQITKPAGNAEFSRHAPVDYRGTPSSVPRDQA